jgi:hypothetical protein
VVEEAEQADLAQQTLYILSVLECVGDLLQRNLKQTARDLYARPMRATLVNP